MRHVYVLNITIPPSRIDNCVDPSKAIVHIQVRLTALVHPLALTIVCIQGKETLSSFLGNVIETVLIKHGFLRHRTPRARVRAHSEDSGSSPPRKRRKVTRKLRRESSEPCSALYLPPLNSADDPDAAEQAFVWTDPRTGQQFQIDQRTGNSFPLNRRRQESGETGKHGTSRRSLALPGALEGAPETPEWIRSALEVCVAGPLLLHSLELIDELQANDAWNLTSKRIPAIKPIPIPENFNPREGSSGHLCARRAIHDLFTDTSIHRFRAEDLEHARVIQQVDTKFISCLMGSRAGERNDNEEPTLVLIDQHAADERVRVEGFLKEICEGFLRYDGQSTGVEVRDLSPPAPILLTKLEAEKLSASSDMRRAFSMWGIDFDFSVHDKVSGDREEDEGGGESAYRQVYVRCVPEVVATKVAFSVSGFVHGSVAQPCFAASHGQRASPVGQRIHRTFRSHRALSTSLRIKRQRNTSRFFERFGLAQSPSLVPQRTFGPYQFQGMQRYVTFRDICSQCFVPLELVRKTPIPTCRGDYVQRSFDKSSMRRSSGEAFENCTPFSVCSRAAFLGASC